MRLTADERETVIHFNDADDVAHVHTHQRTVFTKLSRNPAAELVESQREAGYVYGHFVLPKALVSFRSKRKAHRAADSPEPPVHTGF